MHLYCSFSTRWRISCFSAPEGYRVVAKLTGLVESFTFLVTSLGYVVNRETWKLGTKVSRTNHRILHTTTFIGPLCFHCNFNPSQRGQSHPLIPPMKQSSESMRLICWNITFEAQSTLKSVLRPWVCLFQSHSAYSAALLPQPDTYPVLVGQIVSKVWSSALTIPLFKAGRASPR